MLLDKDKIKESLTKDEIIMLITDLGSNYPKQDSNGNLMFQTVCHCGDKHKLYYYDSTKSFYCYTDCSESFDIYSLIIRVKSNQGIEMSFPKSIKYVASKTGRYYTTNNETEKSNDRINDWDWINKFKKKEKINTELPEFNKNVLQVFSKLYHEDWLNEGISVETMKKFNIGYYLKHEQIAIPHYDINNRLIGIRGRSMLQEDLDNGRKYMPIYCNGVIHGYPMMFNLYGININKYSMRKYKKAIIYEGEKSVLKNHTLYDDADFSCAVCGSNISTYQRDLILKQGVEEVFIAFDKEYEDHQSIEAQLYYEKLVNIASKFTPYVKTHLLLDTKGLLDKKDSPIDKGREVLEELMRNKIEIKTSEGVIE